jgi:hypothetical protein
VRRRIRRAALPSLWLGASVEPNRHTITGSSSLSSLEAIAMYGFRALMIPTQISAAGIVRTSAFASV